MTPPYRDFDNQPVKWVYTRGDRDCAISTPSLFVLILFARELYAAISLMPQY